MQATPDLDQLHVVDLIHFLLEPIAVDRQVAVGIAASGLPMQPVLGSGFGPLAEMLTILCEVGLVGRRENRYLTKQAKRTSPR